MIQMLISFSVIKGCLTNKQCSLAFEMAQPQNWFSVKVPRISVVCIFSDCKGPRRPFGGFNN